MAITKTYKKAYTRLRKQIQSIELLSSDIHCTIQYITIKYITTPYNTIHYNTIQNIEM